MNRMFRKFVCCGSAPHTEPSPITAIRNLGPNSNFHENTEHHIEMKEPAKKKLAKIESIYCTNNLTCSDFRSETSHHLKYNCPICFRFFDQILITNCCKNYLCHFCVDDVNQRVTNDSKAYVALCPFCSSEDMHLKDVDPMEKPKRYTDSPCTINKHSFAGNSYTKEHLSSKFALKTKGRIDACQDIEDTNNLNYDTNKENDDSGLLESIVGDENIYRNRQKNGSPDYIFINKVPLSVREVRLTGDQTYNVLSERNLQQNVTRVERRLFVFEDILPTEGPIGNEARPHLPNCLPSKKSYESV